MVACNFKGGWGGKMKLKEIEERWKVIEYPDMDRLVSRIKELEEGIRELLTFFSDQLPPHIVEGLDKLLEEEEEVI
jgi:hypothetical protein